MNKHGPFYIGLILVALLAGVSAGIGAERAGWAPGASQQEPADAARTFGVFWESWTLVQEKFVNRSAVKPQLMTYGAIQGMLDSLGDVEHTRFLSPDELRREREALQGQLEGIGAELVVRSGLPTVLAPIPGSPAQDAGLRPGDIIVRVDGQEVRGLTLDDIVNRVRGPRGTRVTLTVMHPGDTDLSDIAITRAQINVPNVTWTKSPGTNIAHVLISQFGERATDELVVALRDARSSGATAVILDLRNDPGGLRDEAIGVASQFLGDGHVLIEQDSEGKRTDFPVKPGGLGLDIPMAVLINEGSASSSEIVAGALQDHQRGKLIGATTFGTGTVLGTFDLSDGSAVLLGIAEWFTPKGRQIWHRGIEPDIKVALPSGASPLIPQAERSMTAGQLLSSSDAQLLRAVQELGAIPSP